ncbi:ferredoxin [Streptomyces sp. NPDC001508]|uniref:ferredoxin n=1 Tax=Streptomyces sp. NPDC001508 TaxID=3154656 RepID=UPI00332F9542
MTDAANEAGLLDGEGTVAGRESSESKGCWRVTVDREVCIGSGICVGIAPDHFDLRLGRSQPLTDPVPEGTPQVADAADNCPVEAITVHDAATGLVIAPDL